MGLFDGYKRETLIKFRLISSDDKMEVTSLQHLPEHYRPVYQKHWATIKESSKRGKLRDVYHFPLFENEDSEILAKADQVFSNYTGKIKINVAFGFILKNRTTGELKFFHPSNNTTLLPAPTVIASASDYNKFKEDIEKKDAYEYARTNRPSTNWTIERIICVRFDVYRL